MSLPMIKPESLASSAYAVAWDFLPAGVCVVDAGQTIQLWNRQLAEWTSIDASSAIGQSLTSVLPFIRTDELEGQISELLAANPTPPTGNSSRGNLRPETDSVVSGPHPTDRKIHVVKLPAAPPRFLCLIPAICRNFKNGDLPQLAWQDEVEKSSQAESHSLSPGGDQATGRLNFEISQEDYSHLKQECQRLSAVIRRQTNEFIASKLRETQQRASLEQLVRDLTAARQRAEAAVQAKSDFLTNMSHEIRTPMTAIMGYAELLSDPILGGDQRQQAIASIQQSGQHLLEVINDILDISQIEAGKLVLRLEPIAIVDVVQSVVSMLGERAQSRNLQFTTDFHDPLPARFVCDATRLRQILVNLVGNAIKFTPSGSVRLELRWLHAGQPQGTLLIAVHDTGIGISESVRKDLFQPFSQVDSRLTRQFGGTGLGLAISQRLAQLLGGEISIESELGRGSCFSLAIPCAVALETEIVPEHQPQDPALPPVPVVATGENPKPKLAGARLLVVDDALDNRKLLKFHLSKAGADIELAENGQEAVDLVDASRDQPFDAILMDMQMPVLDGYSATRQLRKRGELLPIIAVTAHAMAGDREKCLEAGCSDYMTKPIQREKLVDTTLQWIQKSIAMLGQ